MDLRITYTFIERLRLRKELIGLSPVLGAALGFAVGIVLGFNFHLSFLLFLFFSFFLLVASIFLHRSSGFVWLSVLLFVCVGILFGIEEHTFNQCDVRQVAPQKKIVLEGEIVTLPEIAKKGKKETVSFVLSSKSLFQKWKGTSPVTGNVQVFLYNPGREFQFGDRVRLRGDLELAKTPRNFNEFDYGRYLEIQGIGAIFRSIGRWAVVQQEKGKPGIFFGLNCLRAHLKARIEGLLSPPYSNLAAAFLFGFRKNIPDVIRDEFVKTGTAHLLAISGFQVSLLGCMFYFLGRMMLVPRQINILVTVLLLLSYTVLTGTQIPAVRTGVMGSLILIGLFFGRERNWENVLWVAFLGMLAWNPSALFSASFQLSFVAVASLLFILPRLKNNHFLRAKGLEESRFRWVNRFLTSTHESLFSSFSVTIGMFPILIWYFHLFSFMSFFANLLVIPINFFAVVSMLFVLLVDLFCHGLALWLVAIPKILFQLQLGLTHYFSRVPFAYFYLPLPHASFFFVYYGLLIGWIMAVSRALAKKIQSAIMIALVFVTFGYFLAAYPRNFYIYLFDLGKTPVIYVSFSNGSNLLIDSGKRFPSNQAYWLLRPYLMAKGVAKIERATFSRMDQTHTGGFSSLADYFAIGETLIPNGGKSGAMYKYFPTNSFSKARVKKVNDGETIQTGHHSFVRFYADSTGRIEAYKILDESFRILYLSFVSPDVLRRIKSENHLNYNLVILPHHEFGISTEEIEFLKRTKPEFLVMNQRNREKEIRNSLSGLNIPHLLFMSETGGIEFSPEGKALGCRPVLKNNSELFPSS